MFFAKVCISCYALFLANSSRPLYCSRSCKSQWQRATHPGVSEAQRQQAREWYHANKERAKARTRRWKREHPDAVRLYGQRRRGATDKTDSFSREEWLAVVASWQHRCAYCGREAPLTADHGLPLSRGGRNTIDNILPACGRCNSQKNTKTEDEFRLLLALAESASRSDRIAVGGWD